MVLNGTILQPFSIYPEIEGVTFIFLIFYLLLSFCSLGCFHIVHFFKFNLTLKKKVQSICIYCDYRYFGDLFLPSYFVVYGSLFLLFLYILSLFFLFVLGKFLQLYLSTVLLSFTSAITQLNFQNYLLCKCSIF